MTPSSKAIAACALLILICIGALSFWSEVRNEEDRQWVTHTLLVVEKLQAIRIDITQAETGQRGYMLTGQDRYLEMYGAGVDQVRQDIKELPDLIQDNSREREAIQRLDPLIASRLAELADGIEVRKRSGLLAGVEAVARANNGEKWMGQIAAQIAEMRHTEAQLLSMRLETAAASSRKMKAVVVCGNALAILILLMKGFVIQRETVRRSVAEHHLKQANERLERRTSELEGRTGELLASNGKLESRTGELLASNSKLESRTGELLASNSKLESRTGELLASNSKLESRTEELLASNSKLENRTGELLASNSNLENRTGELLASNSKLESRTGELLASNSKLESRTAELVASNTELESRTAELLASNSNLESRTGELLASNSKLERRTSELSETNIELESFAYSVAHDLRAPLRHLAGYSSVVLQDYGLQLDAQAQRYLQKIVDGAQKMGRLVDDLLSLSKIGRQDLVLEATPLDSLLRQGVEELALECSEREIEWRIGELFSAECDPSLMKQVFVNLLSNAVKYTGKRDHAVIEVGQTMQNGERAVFVRDNGAGFEMQYVGKLFGIFQRLHKARDFEGTGVGLAIVQRIIRKHGGRIWAEAEPDRGATFFFTLGTPEISPATEPDLTIKEEAMHV